MYKRKSRTSRRRPTRKFRSRRPRRSSGMGKFTLNARTRTRAVLPPRYSTKLVYNEVFNIAQAAGTPWTWEYSGNGMNDPNVSGGGHQPYGFDEMSNLYRNYVVTGVKIVLEGAQHIAPTATAPPGALQISIGHNTLGAVPPTLADAINENFNYITRIVSPETGNFKMKKYYPINSKLGIPRSALLTESSYWGSSTGVVNPTAGTKLNLNIINLNPTPATTASLSVTLVYYCSYFNRNLFGQS